MNPSPDSPQIDEASGEKIKVADGARNDLGRYFIPESDSSERRIAIFLFVLGCCYLWLFRRFTMMDPDEGIILQGAQRIVNGEVLYRDFFSFLTPGSFYQTALLFKVFGSSILVARTALVVMGAVLASVTYLFARRVCSRLVAISTAMVAILATLPYRFVVLHNWDSTLWAILTAFAGLKWIETSATRWAFWAGLGCAVTLLFEQSKGVGVFLGIALCLALLALFSRSTTSPSAVAIFSFVGGCLLPLVAALAFFGAQHAARPMLADLAWPFRHYSAANRVWYGYQNWNDETRTLLFGSGSVLVRFVTFWTVSPCFLIPALPLIDLGLLAVWIRRLTRMRGHCPAELYFVYLNSISAGFLFSIVVVRADIVHFVYLFPFFLLTISWFIEGTHVSLPSLKAVKPLAVNILALAFLLFSGSLLWRVAAPSRIIDTRRGVITAPKPDDVVEFVQQHVSPGSQLFVYPYLPLYYYLTATAAPVSLDYFQPGMSTWDQAAMIIQRLQEQPQVPVLFEYGFTSKIPTSWPSTSLSAIANDSVTDYLLSDYRACAKLRSSQGIKFLWMISKKSSCEQVPGD